MKILAISQVYWPDTASVSQHLTDLLEALASRGSDVSVISSRNDYESPEKKYSCSQAQNGVQILRVPGTSFGKKSKLGRLIDFITFNISLTFKLIFYPKGRYDTIIGMTTPPLVSYIGAKISRFKNKKFVYWTMDLQPELSIIAGYLKASGKSANSLQKKGDYVFSNSDLIITLDHYMRTHIERRLKQKVIIQVIPVWPVMNERYQGSREDNPFRVRHEFEDKIVIMYSGNHSVMHPIATLLDAAVALRDDLRFLFVHIGGGVRLNEVTHYIKKYDLSNLQILPYQPRNLIHYSLGSADIQTVTLGDDCVGYTHPNKIYGAMFIGKPILYIGPKESHISEILNDCEGNVSVKHGESAELISKLRKFADMDEKTKELIGVRNQKYAEKYFHPSVLVKKMVNSIELLE